MSMSQIQKDAMAAVKSAMDMLIKAQDQLKLAERFPVEPESYTVLQFDKVFASRQDILEAAGYNFDAARLISQISPAGMGRLAEATGITLDEGLYAEVQPTSYRYVAIRIGDVWYTTASRTNKTMSWERLVEFIGDSPCWVVESWREIPVEPPEVIESAAIGGDDAAKTESTTLAEVLGANHKQVMETLRKLRANGGNPTPKTIVDALAKIGAQDK